MMKIIILTETGKVFGKTNKNIVLNDGFSFIPFDASDDVHKKAKFLTESPIAPVATVTKDPNDYNVLSWFLGINNMCCGFQSIENPQKKASNSEIRRWFENGAVILNGNAVHWNDDIDFPVESLVLFPNGKRRCTLY